MPVPPPLHSPGITAYLGGLGLQAAPAGNHRREKEALSQGVSVDWLCPSGAGPGSEGTPLHMAVFRFQALSARPRGL